MSRSMWVTRRERQALAVIGLLGLAGLGVWFWQRYRPALHLEHVGMPSPMDGQPDWSRALAAARQVDINRAGVAELERLPGIGPVLARRIVEDRHLQGRFLQVEDLARVPGIGAKRADALTAYVTIE